MVIRPKPVDSTPAYAIDLKEISTRTVMALTCHYEINIVTSVVKMQHVGAMLFLSLKVASLLFIKG